MLSDMLVKLLVGLCLCSTAFGSTTTLTGTLTDAQGNPLNGFLTMQLPTMAQDITTLTQVTAAPVSFRVVNGTITGGAPLYDVANLRPTGLYYITNAYDQTGRQVFSGNFYVTGATFNLGAATPTNITTANVSFSNPVFQGATINGNETITGTFTASGGGTLSGGFTVTATNVNNVIKADQQTGADACAKLVTAMNALPAGGGTVDATGFQGAQTCGTSTNLSKNAVTYNIPPNVTFSATAGITFTISGSDVVFVGGGDTTLFDFSAGTSANDNFHISGSRVRVENIKINGNKVAGGTATCLSIFNSLTSFWVKNNTFTNCGNQALYAFGFSDGHFERNRITSTTKGCIFFDTGSSDVWVEDNTLTGCNTANQGGQGGITVNGNSSTFDSGFHFTVNKITNITGPGFQINSVSASPTRITRNVEVIQNTVDTTTTSGEGIAFTANQIRVAFNRINKTAVTGILVFGVPSGTDSNIVLAGNIISDVSQLVSGNNYGIQFVYGGASLAKMRATDNIIFDDQGGGATTAGAVNFNNVGGAGTIADAIISGTIARGNISSVTVSFSQAADAANVIISGNAGASSGSLFTTGTPTGTTLPVVQTANASGIVLDAVFGTYRLTADQPITAGASLTAIPGLSWTMPANTALNVNFYCAGSYSQATAAASDSFGIQDVTVAPTNIYARKVVWTSTAVALSDNLPTLSTTTATAVGAAFTPSAATTVFNFEIQGQVEQPSNAATSVVQIMAQFTTNNGTIKRGTFCQVY